MVDYETLRQEHLIEFGSLLPTFAARLDWSAEQLAQERQERLRALIQVAKERSPWHRARLAHIDSAYITEADLPSIPPMTKHDMMSNLEGIWTDPRLEIGAVEAHLASLSDDAYLLDEYHVVASGGSSGTRGLFVYGWEAWATAYLTFIRFRRRFMQADARLGPTAPNAIIAAGKASHMTFAMSRTFRGAANITPIPATLPLPEIVSQLNALQPVVISGYPTMLYALTKEAADGRLRVAPLLIGSMSEPLLPEMRRAFEETWGTPVFNVLGTSEGVAAAGCGNGGMHLSEDTAIFEFVDADGQPVPAGVPAAKMYVTNLYNHVQPLIRYELTDEATVLADPCPCGSGMRRIDDIEGRTDDVFSYTAGIIVHPLTFRSRLGGERNIVEYQVRQTPTGADIDVRTSAPIDTEALAAALTRDLTTLGLVDAQVSVREVAALDRQQTGKLKRFVALTA